jgi:hypothetical protein
MLQRVYLLECPNQDYRDPIMLPPQSRLGRFAYPQRQPTAEWPIDYRCRECGLVSRFSAELIRLEGVEAQDRSSLWIFEFSSDHERSARLHWIYSKMPSRSIPEEELINHFLFPTRTWKEDYGMPPFVGTYPI